MITLKMKKQNLDSAEVINLFSSLTRENKNILYINQCNSNIHLIEHLVQKSFRSKIYSTESYEDALTILKTFKFDMIIIDVNHPSAMTTDFMQKLKAQSTVHIPVLLINNQDILDEKQKSFDALIVKPVAIDVFLKKIGGLLH